MQQDRPIFDPKRLRGTLFLALILGGFLAAINFAILAIAGPEPGGAKSNQVILAWEVREEAEERAAGLAQAFRTETKPFLIYVGLSSAREDIDPHGLAANDGWNARVVPVCGKGGNGIEGLLDLTEPISRRRLCPSLVVLCLHMMWLADRKDLATSHPPFSTSLLTVLRQRNWSEALDRVEWWDWILKNSVYVNRLAVSGLHSVKVAAGFFPPIDPWSAPERIGLPPRSEAQMFQLQMSAGERWGIFDSRQYAKEGAQFVALNDLIARFQKLRSPVMIVLMPEMAAFRERIPKEALQVLTDSVEHNSGAATPIVDFRGAIEDADFSDYYHLNDTGRAAFTRILAQAVRDQRSGKDVAKSVR